MRQRAGLPGVLAWDLHPGSHGPHQGARLLQPRRARGIQGPCSLQHEAGAGAGQRAGVRGAEEDLGLGSGHGLHAQVPAEEDRRVLTAGLPDLTARARLAWSSYWEAGLETAKLFIAKEFLSTVTLK